MSAAEKLNTLEKLSNPGQGKSTRDWHLTGSPALRNALPQIVAVVEAAETDLRDGGRANARALAASLAALDEALS